MLKCLKWDIGPFKMGYWPFEIEILGYWSFETGIFGIPGPQQGSIHAKLQFWGINRFDIIKCDRQLREANHTHALVPCIMVFLQTNKQTARLTTSYCAPSHEWSITSMQNCLVHSLISTKLRCALPNCTLVQNYMRAFHLETIHFGEIHLRKYIKLLV